MQRRLLDIYRPFRATCSSHLEGSSRLGLLGHCRKDRQVVLKLRYLSINLRCVTSQKNEDVIRNPFTFGFKLVCLAP